MTEGERQDTVILGVAPDPQDKLAAMLQNMDKKVAGPAHLTLLADPDHAVIDRYGLLNEKAAASKRYLPHPTTYVLDRAGKVTWKYTEVDYKIRPSNETIVAELRKVR